MQWQKCVNNVTIYGDEGTMILYINLIPGDSYHKVNPLIEFYRAEFIPKDKRKKHESFGLIATELYIGKDKVYDCMIECWETIKPVMKEDQT